MDFKKIITGTVLLSFLTACQNIPSPEDKVSSTASSSYQTSSENIQDQASERLSSSQEKVANDESEPIDSTKEKIRETTLSKTDKLRKAIIEKQKNTEDDNALVSENLEQFTITTSESSEEVKEDKLSDENGKSDENKTSTASNDKTTVESSQVDEKKESSATPSFSLDYEQYNSIEQVIEDLIEEYDFNSSKLGIAYQNFVTKESYYLNENEARHAASTNKVGTSVLYLDLINMGALNWDSQLPATEKDIEEGDGRITNNSLRSSYSLKELISNLLVYSDNTAWNILIDYYYENYGDYRNDLIELSGINNKPSALTHKLNYATPNMLIGYLNKIALDDSYRPIIDYMLIAQKGQRFKLYVDEGMATKYGQYGNGYHDTGIYFEDNKPIYSLVLMTNDLGTIDGFMGDLNLRINEWYHYQQTK